VSAESRFALQSATAMRNVPAEPESKIDLFTRLSQSDGTIKGDQDTPRSERMILEMLDFVRLH
jgi:hypothetical protein